MPNHRISAQPAVHAADQSANGGQQEPPPNVTAVGDLSHLVFQAGHVDAVAAPSLNVFKQLEMGTGLHPLGAWGCLWSGQHQMEDVLRGIADIPTGDEPLDDVPGAAGLFERFGLTCAGNRRRAR